MGERRGLLGSGNGLRRAPGSRPRGTLGRAPGQPGSSGQVSRGSVPAFGGGGPLHEGRPFTASPGAAPSFCGRHRFVLDGELVAGWVWVEATGAASVPVSLRTNHMKPEAGETSNTPSVFIYHFEILFIVGLGH